MMGSKKGLLHEDYFVFVQQPLLSSVLPTHSTGEMVKVHREGEEKQGEENKKENRPVQPF